MAVLPRGEARDAHPAHIVRLLPQEVHRQRSHRKGEADRIRPHSRDGALEVGRGLQADLRDVRRRQRPARQGRDYPELPHPEDVEGQEDPSRGAVPDAKDQVRPHGIV